MGTGQEAVLPQGKGLIGAWVGCQALRELPQEPREQEIPSMGAWHQRQPCTPLAGMHLPLVTVNGRSRQPRALAQSPQLPLRFLC